MNPTSVGVLVFAGTTTLALVFYVQYYLPRQLEQRFLESMKAFSKAIELRFPTNTGRTGEVIQMAAKLGKGLGLTRADLHELQLATHLRDIGCCAIPYRPFNEKSRSEWSEYETKVYEKHPEVSGAMLELVPSLRHVANIVRWHHVRFDGGDGFGCPIGYALPMNARILKVASDFVWIENDVGTGAAIKAIQNGKGSEYCPEVVAVFLQVLISSRAKESQPSLA